MLVRKSLFPKLSATFGSMRQKLESYFPGHSQCRGWHPTRTCEYPWALEVAPPFGAILDVGTNEQFGLCLLNDHSKVTWHYTDWDIWKLGTFNGTEFPRYTNSLGHASTDFEELCKKFRPNLTMVLGEIGYLPLQPNYFDIIYCISTLEHVYPEDYDRWFFGLWDLLKPGGTMVITTDHYLDYPPEGGDKSFGHNHDLKKRIDALGIQPNNDDECPWNKNYSQLDEDVHVSVYEYGRLCVYGCTLRKPQ